jgi:hypothetical protein
VSRVAKCFTDHRAEQRIEHSVEELVAQRIHAIACGYKDLNDHDTLRNDPLFALASGKRDPLGQDRHQARDRGCALVHARPTASSFPSPGQEASSRSRCGRSAAAAQHPAR